MSIFDGIEKAKMSMDANYSREGTYISLIRACKEGKNRRNRPFVAVEKTAILVEDDGDGKGHKQGEEFCHMMMADNDSFAGNFKRMVFGIFECDEKEITKEYSELLTGEKNLMGGMFVRHTNTKRIADSGNPYIVVSYKGEVTATELAKMCSEADEAIIERTVGMDKFKKMLEDESGTQV